MYKAKSQFKCILCVVGLGSFSPQLEQQCWLPSCFQVQFKMPVMTFKALQGQGCICLRDCLLPYIVLMYQLRSSSCLLLADPPLQVACLESTRAHAFCTIVHTQWHRLPEQVRVAPSLETFKRFCKTILFARAFLEEECYLKFNFVGFMVGL